MIHFIVYSFNSFCKTFQYDPTNSLSGQGQYISMPEGEELSVHCKLLGAKSAKIK